MSGLTHLDETGAARMVDVGEKPVTARRATASAVVRMRPETWHLIRGGAIPKGDVISTARLAGILAAKRTGDLIPLCHPLGLDSVRVDFRFPSEGVLVIETEAKTTARTGVEMEALTAAAIAALTVYDMGKAVDREMTVERVRLESKSGGKSGDYVRAAAPVPAGPAEASPADAGPSETSSAETGP